MQKLDAEREVAANLLAGGEQGGSSAGGQAGRGCAGSEVLLWRGALWWDCAVMWRHCGGGLICGAMQCGAVLCYGRPHIVHKCPGSAHCARTMLL
jgi:hypothetical protein